MSDRPLPNLIIAGVNKAGTTSLYSYLARHPDICASSIKETCYFLPLRYGGELSPIREYQQHFQHCGPARYIMESTPGYYYGGELVAEAIKAHIGDARIILVFRDPVTRLTSFFRFKKAMMELEQQLSLEEYIRRCESLPPDERPKRENNVYWGIEGGFYADYLPAWFDTFGESVKVLFFEQLRDVPRQLLGELAEWLDIDPAGFHSAGEHIENKSVNYRSRILQQIALSANLTGERFWRSHPRLKQFLRRIYYVINGRSFEETLPGPTLAHLESLFRPYNQRLAVQLSQRGYTDLPTWLAGCVETASPRPTIGDESPLEQRIGG